jgi:hypothetical protein
MGAGRNWTRLRTNPQQTEQSGAAKMSTFLGKYWLIRLLLWVVAAALCFVVWPKLALWPTYSLLHHVSSEPVVLYYDQDRNLMAWDYEANKHWSVAGLAARPRLSFCRAGDNAIALMESSERIQVIDVAPPHHVREYALSGGESFTHLYLVTADKRFAVLREASPQNSTFLVVFDLTTGQSVDKAPKLGTLFEVQVTGSDEFQESTFHSPPRASGRWRLSDQGTLIEVPLPRLYERLENTLASKDKRWQDAVASIDDLFILGWESRRIEVFDPALNSVVATFQTTGSVRICFFTRHDGNVVAQAGTGDITVWNAQNGDKVAELARWPSIARVLQVIAICGLIGLIATLAVAWRAETPRLCFYDFALALTFWLIFRSAGRFRPAGEIDEATLAVNLLGTVAGVYLGLGPWSFWQRLRHGVLLVLPIAIVLTAKVASEKVYDANVYFHPIEIARQCTIPMIAAISACLATAPLNWFGYHVSNTMNPSDPIRLRFGLDSSFAWLTVIAICFGFFQLHLTAWQWRDQAMRFDAKTVSEKAEFAFEFFYMSTLGAATCGIVLAWLGLWQWTRRRAVAFGAFGVLVGLAMVLLFGQQLFWQVPKTYGYLVAIADVVAIFLLPVVTVLVPIIIARRAGYRWVEATPASIATPLVGG